jgi:hypothetical protein
MKLLEVTPEYKVILNKDWLLTIPVFKKLIHRDKGSLGDVDGRKKFRAIKEFTYIYHMTDPRSPLENYEDFERMQKSLQYAELKEKDIDVDILAALTEYEELLGYSVPTLELLRAAKGSKSQLIIYFKTINFSDRDTKGGMVHSPMQHIKNISMLKQLHKDLIEFESLVYSELKENSGVRGKTELGDREQKGSSGKKWAEGSSAENTVVNIEDDPYAEFEDGPVAVSETFKVVAKAPKAAKKQNANAPSFFKIADLNSKID